MKLIRDDEGQTIIFTALLMCVLMGFMALAIDMGVIYRTQRRLQTQADAGAIAGALSAYYGGSTWGTVAKNASIVNGMPSGDSYATNNPPTYGQHNGGEYYEVIIQQPSSAIFMSAFAGLGGGTNYSGMNVGARAVAGIVPGESCVIALNQTAADSVDLQGNATIDTPNCSVQINSSNNTALCTTGNKGTIVTNGIRIVGAQNPSGKCNHLQGNAQTGVASVPDPFANMTFPDPTAVCNAGNTVGAASVTAATPILSSPATSSGLSYSLTCFSAPNVTLSNVTLGSSSNANNFYLFEHGLVIAGGVNVFGTMDLNDGDYCQGNVVGSGCKFSGNNTLSLTAPANTKSTSYAWNGMGFMVNPNSVNATATQCDSSFQGTLPTVYPSLYPAPTGATGGCLQMQFGSNSATLNGIIYAPSDVLYLQDSGGGTQVTDLVANEIYDKASTLIITNNYNVANPYSPLNHVALVE